MWPVYTVIVYFLLALLLPIGWALIPVWRRARKARQVTCPAREAPALVQLDPWYAARRRAFGGYESRIRNCSEWPAHRECSQQCLAQCGPAV